MGAIVTYNTLPRHASFSFGTLSRHASFSFGRSCLQAFVSHVLCLGSACLAGLVKVLPPVLKLAQINVPKAGAF